MINDYKCHIIFGFVVVDTQYAVRGVVMLIAGLSMLHSCFTYFRSYSIHRVAHTNLMLLAVDVGNAFDTGVSNPLEPREVIYILLLLNENSSIYWLIVVHVI